MKIKLLLCIALLGLAFYGNAQWNGTTAYSAIYGRYNAIYPTVGEGYYSLKTNNQNSVYGGLTIQYLSNGILTDGLCINYQGNVGIGTTEPGVYRLSVIGDFNANSIHTSVGKIWAENNEFRSTGNGVDMRLGAQSFINNVGAIGTVSSHPLVFVSNMSEKMRILANGNIGIGTSNPNCNVDIVGDGNSVSLRLRHVNETQENWGLVLGQNSNLQGSLSCAGRDLVIESGWNNKLILGNAEYNNYGGQVIIPGGNVGIGTTTPQNKLDVNGTIRAKEVKVEIGWADFVFAPTYKLRPLTEVEQFIKINGHLPEIPKAEEVQQNGVNLGEMQTKLLQKVEELTLYTIEQDKKMAKQAQENAELKKELNELKELITNKLK